MRLVARAPATSANLGPGFDCFGLALELLNEVVLDTEGPPGVSWEGEGAGELPSDGSDALSAALRRTAELAGRRLPPFRLHGRNRIPVERGLGSSAAAVVAGVGLADRLLGLGLPPDELLGLCVELEGHPDNVAAALRGGLALAYRAGGGWRAEVLAPAAELRPVVLVPEARLPTVSARAALPREVPLEDAAFNAGRAALAVVALTARPELLVEALEDRIHQAVRLGMVPEVAAAFARVREAGVPVCVSGAGPSLLAFEGAGGSLPDLGPGWRVLRVPPRRAGLEVEEAA
ncbi:MAG TPA: homoserine kinase [Actinomycetota bacterium]|nr:homoserine kinase [Actinomycetota bacterium]